MGGDALFETHDEYMLQKANMLAHKQKKEEEKEREERQQRERQRQYELDEVFRQVVEGIQKRSQVPQERESDA